MKISEAVRRAIKPLLGNRNTDRSWDHLDRACQARIEVLALDEARWAILAGSSFPLTNYPERDMVERLRPERSIARRKR